MCETSSVILLLIILIPLVVCVYPNHCTGLSVALFDEVLMYLIVAGFLFVFSACSGGASTEEAAADVVVEEAAPAAAAAAQEVVNEDTVAEEAPAGHSH